MTTDTRSITVDQFVAAPPEKVWRGLTEPELHAFCRDHLAAYQTPPDLDLRRCFLPVASGKVRKNVLHERCPAECLHRPSGDLRSSRTGRDIRHDGVAEADLDSHRQGRHRHRPR